MTGLAVGLNDASCVVMALPDEHGAYRRGGLGRAAVFTTSPASGFPVPDGLEMDDRFTVVHSNWNAVRPLRPFGTANAARTALSGSSPRSSSPEAPMIASP